MTTTVNCMLSKLRNTQEPNSTTIHSVNTGQANVKYDQYDILVLTSVIYFCECFSKCLEFNFKFQFLIMSKFQKLNKHYVTQMRMHPYEYTFYLASVTMFHCLG